MLFILDVSESFTKPLHSLDFGFILQAYINAYGCVYCKYQNYEENKMLLSRKKTRNDILAFAYLKPAHINKLQ